MVEVVSLSLLRQCQLWEVGQDQWYLAICLISWQLAEDQWQRPEKEVYKGHSLAKALHYVGVGAGNPSTSG